MKNPELEALISEHDLTTQKVADLLEVPKRTVDNWRRSEDSAHSNFMSKANLKLLRLLLENEAKATAS